MKKRMLPKLFLILAAVLCLAAVIFLYAGSRLDEQASQDLSFAVEHFSLQDETEEPAELPREESAPKDGEPADGENVIDDGFDLADGLPPADFYLGKVKDFQAEVEQAARSGDSVPTK